MDSRTLVLAASVFSGLGRSAIQGADAGHKRWVKAFARVKPSALDFLAKLKASRNASAEISSVELPGIISATVAIPSPAPLNMGFAEVIADTYPATFRLLADARATWTKTVTSKKPFNLPSGYLADDYQIEVSTTTDITGVVVAETLGEIAQT